MPKSPRKRVAIAQRLARDILKIKLPAVTEESASNGELDQIVRSYYDNNNNNNDRLTAFDPGQPG